MVAQFTAKTTNSEKAIYFLSLIYCLINKVSVAIQILKFYVFRFYLEKKFFALENSGGGWGEGGETER